MKRNIPPVLTEELDTEIRESLERGMAVRRKNMSLSALALAVSILVLLVWNPPTSTVIVLMVSVSALCIVWAVMSMSASINTQFDGMFVLLKFYAEQNRRHQNQAEQQSASDAAERRR